jgi:CBS domain-containing protein
VDVQETIKNYTVRDVLADDFISVTQDTPLAKILELMFHTHQEDFPVIENGRLEGFITRREVIHGVHQQGKDVRVGEIMRREIPAVKVTARLNDVQKLMQKHNTTAMPVEKKGAIVGVVTLDDINRIYVMAHEGYS